MKLTKYTHACVRLEKDGNVLVIDPGIYSESKEALEGAQAVLVTHEHPDHIDQAVLLEALTMNERLVVHAPEGVARTLTKAAAEASVDSVEERIRAVDPGSAVDIAGFDVKTFGGSMP